MLHAEPFTNRSADSSAEEILEIHFSDEGGRSCDPHAVRCRKASSEVSSNRCLSVLTSALSTKRKLPVFASGWDELKSAHMKQHAGAQRGDVRLTAISVPEALSHGMASLRRFSGEPRLYRIPDGPLMAPHGSRRLIDRADSRVCQSIAPVVCKPHRSRHTRVVPDLPDILPQGPSSPGPQAQAMRLPERNGVPQATVSQAPRYASNDLSRVGAARRRRGTDTGAFEQDTDGKRWDCAPDYAIRCAGSTLAIRGVPFNGCRCRNSCVAKRWNWRMSRWCRGRPFEFLIPAVSTILGSAHAAPAAHSTRTLKTLCSLSQMTSVAFLGVPMPSDRGWKNRDRNTISTARPHSRSAISPQQVSQHHAKPSWPLRRSVWGTFPKTQRQTCAPKYDHLSPISHPYTA